MLMRLDPVSHIVPKRQSYADPIEDIFSDVLSSWSILDRPWRTSWSSAPHRIERLDGKVRCEIDVPGVKPEDITVTLDDGYITVAGKRRGSDFSYRLSVSDEYDPESISAEIEDGVLAVTLNEVTKPEPKRIEVKIRK